MTFMNALSRVAKAAVVVAAASAEASAKRNERNQYLNAEQLEAKKWDDRRLQALADIDDGLSRDKGTKCFSGLTHKQEQAIDLRAEVNTNCRNRSEALMAYTEQRIRHFQRSAW